jgi:hypothetical protein
MIHGGKLKSPSSRKEGTIAHFVAGMCGFLVVEDRTQREIKK